MTATKAPELDGTLRAIVAADRIALSETSEGQALLRRRLMVFYGYFALMGTCGVVGGRLRLPIDIDPGVLAFIRNVQAGHALVLCFAYLGVRFWVRDLRLMRAIDVLATVATSLAAALALSVVPTALTADVSAVSFFLLFFTVRAALVPSQPWIAMLVAAVSAVPFAIGLANLYENGRVPDPGQATLAAVGTMLGGVLAVYVVSRTIYGLRRVVEQAVQLGQYVVHEKIGEGGMGAVYRASHAMLKRPTAVKLIAPERAGETATARFEREVMAASRLSHPNTVAIYDFGRTRGGVFYYAMELLDGQNLAHLVESEGPQSVERTLHVLGQLTGALGEAHDAGLVHRDVKPDNVMLCTRGGVSDFVKVLDFGLVKQVANPDTTKITAESSIAGTPLYMAPEAIAAPETVTPAADVYAVGCVAYFLLTGRPPFAAKTVVEVCAAHLHTTPEPPSRHAPAALPGALDALVLRCLEKQPERRPTSRELQVALDALGS